MSFADTISGVLARDSRYSIHAYQFILEALEHAKLLKRRNKRRQRSRQAEGPWEHHVTGQELSEGARQLALQQYGLLARTVLAQWGIRATSDFGELVFNLIDSHVLEKTPTDSRSHFENVYDFETAFPPEETLTFDDQP